MTRTDQLIQAAIRALNHNRALLDAMPDSLKAVQIEINMGRDALPNTAFISPRWGQSLTLQSCGAGPVHVENYQFPETTT
jgi:hypothetical protein